MGVINEHSISQIITWLVTIFPTHLNISNWILLLAIFVKELILAQYTLYYANSYETIKV